MESLYTPANDLAVEQLEKFSKNVLQPVVLQYPDRHIPKEVAHNLMLQLSPFGIGSGWVPENDGGLGVDYLTSGRLYEALAKHCPELAGMSFVHEGAAMKILQGGSDAIKQAYLPGLISGDLIGCSAVTEPGGGSNVRAMRTRAKDAGDHYTVTGEKMWISNGSIADVILLTARREDDNFIMLLVDPREVTIERREIKKLGLNGWSLGQLNFDGVSIPKTHVIGDPKKGLRETMRGFERARCFVSTIALGLADAALEHSMRYAKERSQFGKLLGEHQMIQAMIARMATDLHASRLLVHRALSLLDQGVRCNMEAAMAKVHATEMALRVTSDAIQIHGAFGITPEFPVERLFRAARMLTIPDGTTQINQLVIARELLALDAF